MIAFFNRPDRKVVDVQVDDNGMSLVTRLSLCEPGVAIADADEFNVQLGDTLPLEATILAPVLSVDQPPFVIREGSEAIKFPLPEDYSDCLIGGDAA